MSISSDECDFSTPLQSQRQSYILSSPSSCTSVYVSAQDFSLFEDQSESSSSMDAKGLLQNDIELGSLELNKEGANGHGSPTRETKNDLFFTDNVRSIDFVLVYREDDTNEMADEHKEKRRVYHANLEEDGVEIEIDTIEDISLKFVKLHAPIEVCMRYAEILKLRMPMKKKLDDNLVKNRIVFHVRSNGSFRSFGLYTKVRMSISRLSGNDTLPGMMAFELTTPAVFQDVSDFISRFFNFVRVDAKLFPPKNKHFTAIYSRHKDYLFELHDDFFTPAIRARILDFILRRKNYQEDKDPYAVGIEKLLAEGAYEAAYPIHDGDLSSVTNKRAILFDHWASIKNFYKYQPLDHIKDYFGVKIGLYFAWLGFYTYMLIPASVVGFFCFIYAVSTVNFHEPSNDICDHQLNITMCPLCDVCDYWSLDETCFHAKATYLVDNPSTVFFACFMSFWAVLFLEMWKRYSAEITHRWDLTGFDIREEHPRPEYLARLAKVKQKTINLITGQYEPKPPFWKMRLPGVLISFSSVFLLVMMAFAAMLGVILYRMSVLAALSLAGNEVVTSYAMILTSVTAAIINLLCILIFNQLYERVAKFLTELELPRTQTEFDDSLTLKIYLLQFINYYASIFYIAFVKGKLVGYPGEYNRIFGSRQEECSPGGCLLELSVQLAIIMVGKQAMNTVVEMIFPLIFKYINMLMVPSSRKDRNKHVKWPRWAKDFRSVNFDPRGLFPEYLEMVLQYGFVTIFVTCFPLAPLFAFLNNVFETRLDAKKLLSHYRRPVSQRVKDIGVWFRILDSIGKLAVVTNGFIIAFTSNFIPELVYRHVVSSNNSLQGFLNHSLAVFNVSHFEDGLQPKFQTMDIDICRYPDYRNSPDSVRAYQFAPIFWHILAARLAFVVVFENVVCLIMIFVKWLIPDVPFILKEQIRREAYVTNELIVSNELMRARGAPCPGEEDLFRTPPVTPLRRMHSEPARTRPRYEVRFRTNPNQDQEHKGDQLSETESSKL